MRKFAASVAVLLMVALGGCKGDDVDVDPGKGNEGVGNPAKSGDQGDKGEGDKNEGD
jgi:hypothetical protein